MKNVFRIFILGAIVCSTALTQSLTSVLLPRYIEGINGTNANRIPYAFRLRLTGLTANATYRYFNQIVASTDAATTNGAGNCIFAMPSGDFVRTTGPSLSTAGNHATFTTDAAGTYEGWFVSEPTGNARFTPGRYVFMRVMLNDGASGTSVATRLTTADSVRVVKLSTDAGDTTGTGLRCTSAAAAKDFVFAYESVSGSERPIAGTFVESDGTENTAANSYAAFYANNVNTVAGAFGTILPNALPSGIRRFERRSLGTGSLLGTAVDADGVWPSGASTVNPGGGTTEIVLTGTDVSFVTAVSRTADRAKEFSLSQNYPNPFNPSTRIAFAIPKESLVRLEVFSLIGERVALLVNERKSAGSYAVQFNASRLPSGFYLYKLSAEEFVSVRKMAVVK